jgi:hypothetical protein
MSLPRQTSHSSLPSKWSLQTQQTTSRSLLPSPHFHTQYDEAVESIESFQPFFTLIDNPSTSEHHHPTVHYIFADDDAEIITEAACRALAHDNPDQKGVEESRLPATADGVREHYILLDVQPGESGYEITKANSLSSEWQVLNASITDAPTIDGSESGEGLMLKIEGIGAVVLGSEQAGKIREKVSLQQMVDRFEAGLAEIKKIVDAGEER